MAQVKQFDVDISAPGHGVRIRVDYPSTEEIVDEATWQADKERYRVIEVVLVRMDSTMGKIFRIVQRKNRYE